MAAVSAPTRGFVAAIRGSGRPLIVASLGGAEPTTSPSHVAAALELASGAETAVDPGAAAAALDAVQKWLVRRDAAEITGVDRGAVARTRRRVLDRISRVAARAPRHLRSVVGPLAAEARRAALMPLAAGAERVLAELAEATLADQAWLRALAAFGELHRRGPHSPAWGAASTSRVIAVLLLADAVTSPPWRTSAPPS